MPIQHFKNLIAWQKGHDVALTVYKVTKKFPKEEIFSLTNQLQRAAVSITSNIAEGFGRGTSKDKNQFYTIAKGSVLEVESQLLVAKDLGYITEKESTEFEEKLVELQKILSGLIKSSFDR